MELLSNQFSLSFLSLFCFQGKALFDFQRTFSFFCTAVLIPILLSMHNYPVSNYSSSPIFLSENVLHKNDAHSFFIHCGISNQHYCHSAPRCIHRSVSDTIAFPSPSCLFLSPRDKGRTWLSGELK